MPSHGRPYRFGPRDRQGFVFGVRASQALTIFLILLVAIAALHAVSSPLRIPLAIGEVGFGLAGVFLPVRGRTIEQWAPVVARFSSSAISGGHRDVAVPMARERRAPAVFSPLSLIGVPVAGSPDVGVVHDRQSGTLTGVLQVGGESFALLDDDERERRVNAWSGVLASVANGAAPPFRLQWIQRTVPDRREAIRERAASAAAGSEGVVHLDVARRSYRELVVAESEGAFRHETFIALSMRAPRSRGFHQKRRLGEPALEAIAEELVRALSALRRRCVDAGLAVDGALSLDGLRGFVRRSFARGDVATASLPWPVACEETWSALRTDGTWHTTFWIAEWPRSEVGSDFLLPLLLESDERRALSIVMAPVEARKALHRAERARTTARADRELLGRHGFARSAQTAKEHESVERREEELAAGHAGYRFSGYLVVTADTENELERSCARVEQAAAVSRLELSRLYGAQADGFLTVLPVGRGCS